MCRVVEFGRIALHCRKQLNERIELQKLYARVLENFLTRHALANLCNHAIGARVAIMIRIADESAAAVKQRVIHAPCINADSVQRVPLFARDQRYCRENF